MKKIFISCLITLLFFICHSGFASEIYTLDPTHTEVLWHINHLGFSNPSGKWMASGTLVLDEDNLINCQVRAIIQTADLVTALPELDSQLKSPLFFDVKRFPTATFVSNKIGRIGKQVAFVEGILTLHGVAKPVKLLVKLNKIGKNSFSNKKTVGFTASTKIKRSDFGMTSYMPGLSDEVNINIEAEAYKESGLHNDTIKKL